MKEYKRLKNQNKMLFVLLITKDLKFNESGKFSKMVKQLKIQKSAFMLKINLHVLITKYPKLKNLFLSIN